MKTCATQEKIIERVSIGNLILPVPETDFRDFLEEVDELAQFAPEIIEAIEKDLDANARAKKILRLADKKFYESLTEELPEMNVEEAELLASEMAIGTGRPRMSAWMVGMFVMIRGFPGGTLTSKSSRRFLRESMSLYGWLKEMDKLEFQICLVAGKANSKGKSKKRYRKLLRRGRKATDALDAELNRLEQDRCMETLPPSRRVLLQRVLQQIKTDLSDANRVLQYAYDRVFHDKNLRSTEKVLSLSDGTAAYIKKGSRNPLIGYKPQLVRSEKGFVTSLLVPQGNAANSIKLDPAISASIMRTGVIAALVSTDDGYASSKGRREVLNMGVKDVSISGAKGKKLTDPVDWVSEEYRDARRNRSAVESLMFTIKDGFEFGELGRRGLDAVRSELMEKVLAYNCCRIILMKKRRRVELEKAA